MEVVKDMGVLSVVDYDFPISEENVNELQGELDQVLVLMGLSEMNVVAEVVEDLNMYKIVVKATGDKKGWLISFLNSSKGKSLELICKLEYHEKQLLKVGLQNIYGDKHIKNMLGGLRVVDSEIAMIDLFKKIKAKV